ncbi:hypothetical protein [Komarekiella delphini-convector]|uniref:hypothetical protein n=1 Tax=Komarekiella delphini-convector TaxID=3050158 RepID=UPI001CD8DFAA|nr:hypothetical protein [Komarekiella delphini-convector]
MNGNRYVLDTNAIVSLLQGSSQLIQLLQDADWIGVSVISQIEFLAFSGLFKRIVIYLLIPKQLLLVI